MLQCDTEHEPVDYYQKKARITIKYGKSRKTMKNGKQKNQNIFENWKASKIRKVSWIRSCWIWFIKLLSRAVSMFLTQRYCNTFISGKFRLVCFKNVKNKQHSSDGLIFALKKIACRNLADMRTSLRDTRNHVVILTIIRNDITRN
jgi:hypothetical protein